MNRHRYSTRKICGSTRPSPASNWCGGWARITPEVVAQFHTLLAEEQDRYRIGGHRVTLGEIVERALVLLKRDVAQRKDGTRG